MFVAIAKARSDQRGFVGVMVAILVGFGALLVVGALVVDIGLKHVERRELQNGADAAVMAAAFECSFRDIATSGHNCSNALTQARTIASANASDTVADIAAPAQLPAFCGRGNNALSACSGNGSTLLCPNTLSQSSAINFVQVTTATKSSTSSVLPSYFASLLGGTDNGTIHACAQAQWGPPKSHPTAVFPIAMNWECWYAQVQNSNAYGPPSYAAAGATSWTRWIRLTGGSSTGCYGSNSLASGFGWTCVALGNCSDPALNSSAGCNSIDGAAYHSNMWVQVDTGNNLPATCADPLFPDSNSIVRTMIVVPLYDCIWAQNATQATGTPYVTPGGGYSTCASLPAPITPNERHYHIVGFAPFLFSGFWYGSGSCSSVGSCNNVTDTFIQTKIQANVNQGGQGVCTSNERCLFGWFTQSTLLAEGEIGDDNQNYFGLNVVRLIG